MFLGYYNIAFPRELNNASVKFKWLFNRKLLALFCKKVSLSQMLLLRVYKGGISQEESIVSLKANNTKVVRSIAL